MPLISKFASSRMALLAVMALALGVVLYLILGAGLQFTSAKQTYAHDGLVVVSAVLSFLLGGFVWALTLSFRRAGKLSRINLTLRKETSERAHLTAELRQFFSISPDILCTLDLQGRFRQANPAIEHILEFGQEEIEGTNFNDLIHPDDRARVELEMHSLLDKKAAQVSFDAQTLNAVGLTRWVEWSFVAVDWEAVYYGYGRDIHDRKQMEKELHFSAFHDKLTGAANRALFLDRLNQLLQRANRHMVDYALLIMDIDNFKTINDSYGHLVGDELLKEFANRIQGQLRPNDTLARFGGDEFILLAEKVSGEPGARALAGRILEHLHKPFFVKGVEFVVGSSIGITLDSGRNEHADQVIRRADLALYKAKENGKGDFVVFDQQMQEEQLKHANMELELRLALQQDVLIPHYQAIVDISSGKITGCETLCRWPHATMGNISPAEFIPVAEATGLICAVGRRMIALSCESLAIWRTQGLVDDEFMLSVNLAPQEFFRVDLFDFIQSTLNEHKLPGRNLCIEVTERVLIERDGEASVIFEQLRAQGVQIFVDDFGTGYSSLSYLRSLPIDGIKLDRTFIERIHSAEKSQEIARTVLELANALDLKAIVEGVETQDQLDFIADMGFGFAQGFGLARPVDGSSFVNHLKESEMPA